MKQGKSCMNCIKGTVVSVNNDVLCREKGIVSPDYTCRRHRSIPDAKTFKEKNYKCSECENFIINTKADGEALIGLCQLFSVREFDGKEKNACSKFVKNAIQYVS